MLVMSYDVCYEADKKLNEQPQQQLRLENMLRYSLLVEMETTLAVCFHTSCNTSMSSYHMK
jgi:hypothetical protein